MRARARSAQHEELLSRATRTPVQTVGHLPVQPLTAERSKLSASDVPDMTRIDEQHGAASRCRQLEQRNPVHSTGLRRDDVDMTGLPPVRVCIQIDGRACQLAYHLVIAIRW